MPSDAIHAPPGSALSPAAAPFHTPAAREHAVRGLDSIRLWCAIWVYFSHDGFIPLSSHLGLPRIAIGLYNNLFCGVAGVIAFFIISGFCIHYPFVRMQKVPLAKFYVRRYIRILPPLAAALLLAKLVGQNIIGYYEALVWSLIAELIYYTIYPALHRPLTRWPGATLAVAYAIALVLIASYPSALNYHEFGPALTWLVGLPCWLLGCRLATWAASTASSAAAAPWLWRGSVWFASSVASMLRFHANVGYPFTLTLFGVLAFFWLRAEIRHYRFVAPPVYFENCGRWSYSLYLAHPLAALGIVSVLPALPPVELWTLQTISVFVGSYCFYLAVEGPSHRLARYCARQIST